MNEKIDWNNEWEYWVQKHKEIGDWTVNTSYPSSPKIDKSPFPTEDVMLLDVFSRTEETGFVEDIMSWLRSCAPRKIVTFLKGLCSPHYTGPVSYESLCEAVYQLGFRASELIERRMVLGSGNKWVKLYFEEFPIGS